MKNFKVIISLISAIIVGILAKVLVPFVEALPPVAAAIAYLQNTVWDFPSWVWVATGILIILIALFWLIAKRLITISNKNVKKRLIAFARPRDQWEELGYVEYFKVHWKVRKPSINYYSRSLFKEDTTQLDKIDVEILPYCPSCTTVLEEKHAFLGKYIWKCVGCDFKIRSKKRFNDAAEIVEKRVKGELRKKIR